MEDIFVYKILPYAVYIIAILGAIIAGYLVYDGLMNRYEKIQSRLRFKRKLTKGTQQLVTVLNESSVNDWLKKAGNPLGLNGFIYSVTLAVLVICLTIYYVVFPFILSGEISFYTIAGILTLVIMMLPLMPFSLFTFAMQRLIDYKNSKKNAEVYMLYDLLISELEMMNNTRISTYSVIRNLQPYFTVIYPALSHLLSQWTTNEGPNVALDNFAIEIGTEEAKSLVTVLKNMDQVDRNTALDSLKGMNQMFVKSAIESYRTRRKVVVDIFSMPIKFTHLLITLNFLILVITMVMVVLNSTHSVVNG